MRNAIKIIASKMRPFLKLVLSLFFERKYLEGRYFDIGYDGYLWALKSIWIRNILRLGVPRPWPTGLTCHVSNAKNIFFHPDDLNNFQSPGTYFQNFKGLIHIGHGSYIGPNVGLITANHRLTDLDAHEDAKDIVLGENCWIGMNSVLLPGVILGPRTVVAAGSVVTKSFPEGNVVIGGVPAKSIKMLCSIDSHVLQATA
ncbi:DapH/DapD/GlmU-related protein [Variovorax sp. J22R115]|uniref:DapH/DapD/GlmU-related protein n=1 Tax=Variovorax sp. J22R115 TaxID=3053509 RepID=UPI0025786701|nr:DapH/DapD/GlmU-related protein [Variovorax sp. J22R115]MDM0053465.1 DapH/DapD/GlmU-related protein [Variovorax sp. J22R115]